MKEATGLDDATIHRYHEFIGTVLSWAVEKNWLPYNVCYRQGPTVGPRKEHDFYTDEQVDEFVESLRGADIRFIVVACIAFFMGLRRAEICGLDIYKDINLDRGYLTVRNNYLYTHEDGCFLDTTKTAASVRTLMIPQPVQQAILALKEWRKRQKQLLGDRWKNSSHLITTEEGAPIHPDTVSYWMRRHRKKYHLPYITLRGARHTNATILIYNHVDIASVANNLGHASITTTLNRYTHAIVESGQKDIANTINNRFGKSVELFESETKIISHNGPITDQT